MGDGGGLFFLKNLPLPLLGKEGNHDTAHCTLNTYRGAGPQAILMNV